MPVADAIAGMPGPTLSVQAACGSDGAGAGTTSAACARGAAGTPMRASASTMTPTLRNTLAFALSLFVWSTVRDNARYVFVVMLRVTCRGSIHRSVSARQDD